MRKILIIASLSIAFIWGPGSGLSSEYNDIQVLQSDASGVILKYNLSDFMQQEKIIENQVFNKISVPKCPLTQTPGEPQLPMRIVILGVPLGCEVKASI